MFLVRTRFNSMGQCVTSQTSVKTINSLSSVKTSIKINSHNNEFDFNNAPFKCPHLPSENLMNIIASSHSIAMNNHFLLSSNKILQFRQENHIKYMIITSKNQASKPINITSKTNIINPFAGPFIEGSHICNLGKNYRLLFNKYPILPYHLLIVSKQFIHQNTILLLSDFVITYKVFKSLLMDKRNKNSLIYFNSGMYAGATQKHKHLQILPNIGKYSLLNYISDEILNTTEENISKNEIYMWNKFEFLHGIILFNEMDINGFILHKYYLQILQWIENKIDNKYIKDNKISYNMLITDKMIIIIPRKYGAFMDNKMNKMWYNALPFAGLICCSPNYMNIFDGNGLLKVLNYCCFHLNKSKNVFE